MIYLHINAKKCLSLLWYQNESVCLAYHLASFSRKMFETAKREMNADAQITSKGF